MSFATGPTRIPADLRGELLQVSRYAGSDLLLAQGSGGNTSVKSEERCLLWVKASGLRMADIGENSGYVEARLAALVFALRDPALEKLSAREAHEETVRRFQSAVCDGQTLRPSLETGFHAVLGRVVLHTHPVYGNAFACMNDGRAALEDALPGEKFWIPYAAPGYELARRVDQACACAAREPNSILLENHGHIASARTAGEAIALTERIIAAARTLFGELPANAAHPQHPSSALTRWASELENALRRRFLDTTIVVTPASLGGLADLARNPERWPSIGALVPDDVVYGPAAVIAANPAESPAAWAEKNLAAAPGKTAMLIAGEGVALIAPHAALARLMEENLLANVLTRKLIARRGVVQELPREHVAYLQAMESEKYRQKMAAAR